MKLWEKGIPLRDAVDRFTTGHDRQTDLHLARYDVIGSMAHVVMLGETGILSSSEKSLILKELGRIHRLIEEGQFVIGDGTEDVHTRVEQLLTEALGDPGLKIHTGRSRNDQVLVDIRLYTREWLQRISRKVQDLFSLLLDLSDQHREILMPGYTHMQVAMPSSFGIWWGSFAESLVDDMTLVRAAVDLNDQNPLGTAAGYGSSFPVNRELTTRLLGFRDLCVSSVYAQGSRGKTEWAVSSALASLAQTLVKLATDIILFLGPDFGFLSLNDEYTTGSSIMPHKKNPDVFELIRARSNRLKTLPAEIMMIAGNLPSGYHRDFQEIKEIYLPAFPAMEEILEITRLALDGIEVSHGLLEQEKYGLCFSVEEVNRLVLEGVPFREAYREVSRRVEAGTFHPGFSMPHSHLGSIGNPGTDILREKMTRVTEKLDFSRGEQALEDLLKLAGS